MSFRQAQQEEIFTTPALKVSPCGRNDNPEHAVIFLEILLEEII